MATVNGSGGDGLRIGYDELVREGQTQETASRPCAVPEEAAALSPGQTPPAQTPFRLGADYRRFLLDEELSRQTSATLTPAAATTQSPDQSRADLEARARRIFERFQNDGFLGLSSGTPYADIAAELEGLTQADARLLRDIYRQRYSPQRGGRDLLSDIALEVGDLGERLRAFQILAPERVHVVERAAAERGPRPTIFADVAMDELVTGTNVRYTFDEGHVIAPAGYRGPFVRHLIQDADGRTQTMAGGTFEGQYRNPGVYRVTFEVTNQGQPPEFYLLRQVVRDPAERAREALLRLPGTTVEPGLFLQYIDMQVGLAEQRLSELKREREQLMSRGWLNVPQYKERQLNDQIRQLEDGLSQLRRIQKDAPVKLFGGAAGPVIPLQAALVAAERPQPVALQLYAKPLGNNRWAVVDLNSPSNARVYEGAAGTTDEEGLRNAWREFVSANNLPAGQVAALPPRGFNFPAQEVWNDRSDGQSGFQQWATGLGWGSLVLAGLGVVAAVVPGAQWAAPPLFIAAGVTGAGSGAASLYDRARYGSFRWDSPETALDLLSIVGGFAGAGGGVGALLRRGTVVARTAEGASVTFRSLGDKYTLISQGIDQGAALAGGVIIGNVWLEQIDRINRSGLPPEEKRRQVGVVLQQASMMGGVIVVGGGVSRFARLADDELALLLRGANFDSELEEMIRTTPGLQRALQEQGADRLRRLYENYKAGGVNRTEPLHVNSFLRYVSSNGVPTRVDDVPQSLTEGLGISGEGLRRMTARELNETMLARTEPNLFAAVRRRDLPPAARAALEEVLANLNIANAPSFKRARGLLSETLNARLGESVTNVAELRRLLSSVTEPASRGSIGEYFYQSRLMAGGQLRKREFPRPEFERAAPGSRETAVYPDFLRTDSRRTLDVKTGYDATDIEINQIRDYNALITTSQSRGGGALRRRLEQMGVAGGRLDGHDYLFISNGTGSALQAAQRAHARVTGTLTPRQAASFNFYYLGDDGNIYRYLGQNNSVKIGPQMPN